MKYIWHVAKTRLSRDMHTSRDSQFEEHFTSKVRDEAPSHKKHALSPSEMKYKSLRSESSTEINNEFERVDSDFEIQRVFSRILNNSTQGTEKVVLRDDLDMLPVPFARNRLVETLGSITRVCFVDDDVICEGFSVTEEIFLLNSADTVKGIGARSTMLDLHGNSKADGSRFEDPNWAKYLPSLKPMGLSAALTAEATPIPRRNSLQVDKAAVNAEGVTPRLPVVNETEPLEIGPDGNARRRGSSLSTTDADVAASAMETAFSSSLQVAAHESMAGSSPKGDSKIFSEETKHSREDNLNSFSSMLKNRQKYAKPITGSLEHSLIMHVRETIPSEVLTDLASEIGFVEEDISTFTRLVEMNVLAPCLGNDRVVEDTHLWGQEQTRRRGTLVSSARAVVVDDGRSGSMQLLSHGAPPLILSYCREYWDGAHITHISSADRKEVLDVYGRWALEDFDVVAFGYSPLPSYMEKIMHTSYNDNLERGRLSGRSTGFQRIRSRSMRFSNTSGASRYSPQDDAQDEFKANIGEGRNDLQTSCLFYVDPSTEGLMHLSAASRDRNTFKLIEEDNSEDEYYPPKSGETNRPHHHHHHRRHLGRGTTTENQEGPYIAKAYSISIDNSNSVENGTIVDPVLRETALIGTSNELIQRSVSAGDANFLIKPESYSISEGTELFMDGSTVDSPSVNSRLSFHAASTLSGGSFLVEKSFDSTVTPNRSRSNKPLLIEDSMLRAQSGDELSRLGNMSPAGLRRMRSSSFSGDVAPARSELIVTDNDDIERGYQSDPCAEIFINVPESARER